MEQTIAGVDQELGRVHRRMIAADEADDLGEVVRCQGRLDELLDLRNRVPRQRSGGHDQLP